MSINRVLVVLPLLAGLVLSRFAFDPTALFAAVAGRYGLPSLRPWEAALADYLERAGLHAAASVGS